MGYLGDIVYKPGISFRNAPLARPATQIRRRPWFYQPMSGGPMTKQAKLRRWDQGNIRRYRTVWNRGAKMVRADKLGHAMVDVPNYDEIGLGQAPGPTDTLSTLKRDPLGFLSNILSVGAESASKVAESMQRREEERIVAAQAQIRSLQLPEAAEDVASAAIQNWPITLGVLGIGGFMMWNAMQRRKK